MRFQPRSILVFALASLATVALGGCARPDLGTERAAIEQAVNNSIGWALTKDTVMLYDCLAQDSTFFIFHPNAEAPTVGWDEFTPIVHDVWLSPAFKATHFEVKDLRINLSRSGDVAWYSALLDDCGEWEGEPGCWENARWTGVAEKRDGRWVIAQMHFSFPANRIRAEYEDSAG